MRKSGRRAPAAQLRHSAARVSSGPWVLCADEATGGRGALIVGLGRTAGGAVTRSRVRRLARSVLQSGHVGEGRPVDLLLFVRQDVSHLPRRKVRAVLAHLLSRVPEALRRRRAAEK